MLREFVDSLGLSGRLASVRTVTATGGEMATDPEGAIRPLADLAGSNVVIVGGAALAGFAGRMAPHVPIPVLCSVKVGVRTALALAGIRGVMSGGASASTSRPIETTGLTAALERKLRE